MDLYKRVGNERVILTTEEKTKILAEWAESDKYKSENSYKEKRLNEYPSTDELIVALWESVVELNDLAKDDLNIKRLAIKAKYPKPL